MEALIWHHGISDPDGLIPEIRLTGWTQSPDSVGTRHSHPLYLSERITRAGLDEEALRACASIFKPSSRSGETMLSRSSEKGETELSRMGGGPRSSSAYFLFPLWSCPWRVRGTRQIVVHALEIAQARTLSRCYLAHFQTEPVCLVETHDWIEMRQGGRLLYVPGMRFPEADPG